MQMELSEEQAQVVRHRIEAGWNRSGHEVLDEALRLLIEDELLRTVDLDELNVSLDGTKAQFDNGDGVEWNLQEFLAEARKLRAERAKKAHA